MENASATVSETGQQTISCEETFCEDGTHADTLAELFRNRLRYAVHQGKWRYWNGKVWETIGDSRVIHLAREALLEHYRPLLCEQDASRRNVATRLYKQANQLVRLSAALKILAGRDGVYTKSSEWDRNPWLLNLNNGILDLEKGVLLPHSPEYLCTKLAPVDYSPGANGTKWRQHIQRFLPNPNVRRQVQRYLGSALVGVVSEEVLQIWYGTGANGKTTTVRALLQVLGDYADRTAPNLLVKSGVERHPTEIADLVGLRLAFSTEIDQGKHLAEALVKELTGGDRKKARFMRQDFFSFEQTFNLVLITNHKPVISGTDEGIWRRIQLIPWEVSIPPSERRPQDEVIAELAAEGSEILNWLLDGLADWKRDRHWIASEVKAASEAYRREMDAIGDFLAECCELDRRYEVPKATLYAAYERWCQDNGERPISRRAFTTRLQDRGISGRRAGYEKVRMYCGIRLRPEAERLATDALRPTWKPGPTQSNPDSDVRTQSFGHISENCGRSGRSGRRAMGDYDVTHD
ncbi:MAG: phage/plasmid primase, P4 family [Candidatus Caldarchaeum sp.]